MIVKIKRFGLPYNPRKEKRMKNKITKHIVVFLCLFIVIVAIATVGFAMLMRNYISCLTINRHSRFGMDKFIGIVLGWNYWQSDFWSPCLFRSILYD